MLSSSSNDAFSPLTKLTKICIVVYVPSVYGARFSGLCDNTAMFTYSLILHTHLGCRSTQFQCANGQCISASSRCGGIRTCSDGSDERNCRKFVVFQFTKTNEVATHQLFNKTLNQRLHMHSYMFKSSISVQQSSMCPFL